MNQSNVLLLVLFLQFFHRNLRLWLVVVVAVLRSIDILSLIKLILINFLALVGIVNKCGIIVFANRH
jgi:hypothetical protein